MGLKSVLEDSPLNSNSRDPHTTECTTPGLPGWGGDTAGAGSVGLRCHSLLTSPDRSEYYRKLLLCRISVHVYFQGCCACLQYLLFSSVGRHLHPYYFSPLSSPSRQNPVPEESCARRGHEAAAFHRWLLQGKRPSASRLSVGAVRGRGSRFVLSFTRCTDGGGCIKLAHLKLTSIILKSISLTTSSPRLLVLFPATKST